jgi:hypothetical protein
MHAYLQVKAVSKWEVQQPQLLFSRNTTAPAPVQYGFLPDGYWEVVKLERNMNGSNWKSPSFQARWAHGIRKSITEHLAVNFEVS